MNSKLIAVATILTLSLTAFTAEKKKLYTPVKFPTFEKATTATSTAAKSSTKTAAKTAAKTQEVTWFTDYEAAKAKAKEEKKPMMLLFTGTDWCGACRALESKVFSTNEFKEYASKKLILVKLEFPKKTELDSKTKAQNNRLQSKYNPQGFPTCYFITADEKELGKVVGYSEEWLKKAKKVVR